MAINPGINADQHSLEEILAVKRDAGTMLQTAEVEERKVLAQEQDEKRGGFGNGGLFSDVEMSGSSGVSSVGKNRFDVGADLALTKAGLPSVQLACMVGEVISDRRGLFSSLKRSMDGKSLGYGTGSKGGKLPGIKTPYSNDVIARSNCVSAFNQSGCKGVQASKSGAPNTKLVKDIVCGKRMAHEKTFYAAQNAEKHAHASLGQARRMGIGAPTLTHSLASGPTGPVDPEEMRRKIENKNIFSDDGSATV